MCACRVARRDRRAVPGRTEGVHRHFDVGKLHPTLQAPVPHARLLVQFCVILWGYSERGWRDDRETVQRSGQFNVMASGEISQAQGREGGRDEEEVLLGRHVNHWREPRDSGRNRIRCDGPIQRYKVHALSTFTRTRAL